MRKTLSEIKQLSNIKVKKVKKVKKSKPKVIHPTEYITSVLIASDQIIKEVDKFQKFCFEENISPELANKLRSFAQTESFINYIALTVFAIINDPDVTVYVPYSKYAERYSQEFALAVIKHLTEELETESVESLCLRADEEMQQFKEMDKDG